MQPGGECGAVLGHAGRGAEFRRLNRVGMPYKLLPSLNGMPNPRPAGFLAGMLRQLHRLCRPGPHPTDVRKTRMASKSKSKSKATSGSDVLKGWRQIADFLGEPTSVVERWASEGMPVRRQGRSVTATAKELNDWMGKESGKPVHIATGDADLTSELKRAVSFARRGK